MGDFRKLKVWMLAKDLAKSIYQITKSESISNDFRFKDQIRSAAVSISSNIAEGDELSSNKQSIRHFYIAKGSCAELKSLLILAFELDYITQIDYEQYYQLADQISIMLYKLIQVRNTKT